MMFPFEETEEETQEENLYIPREYGIDFETGQLSGKMVEYENLVGKSYSEELTDSELERMTEECLTENPYITGIENFSCIKQEEKITLTFRLITELGDGEVNTDV